MMAADVRQQYDVQMHRNFPSICSMSVEETANWILSIGKKNSWPKSKLYANSFRWNEVSGDMLRSLSDEVLESDLLIENKVHRSEILSIISSSFHNANNLHPGLQVYIPIPQKEQREIVKHEANQENKPLEMRPSAQCEIFTSVDETSRWILHLGESKSWAAAKTYADSFRYNEISRDMLGQLTSDLLESDLGIKNDAHRREILSSISNLLDAEIAQRNIMPLLQKSGFVGFTSESHSVHLQRLCEDESLYYPESGTTKSTKSRMQSEDRSKPKIPRKPESQSEIRNPKISTTASPFKYRCLKFLKLIEGVWLKKYETVFGDQEKAGRARLVIKLENGTHAYRWVPIKVPQGTVLKQLNDD